MTAAALMTTDDFKKAAADRSLYIPQGLPVKLTYQMMQIYKDILRYVGNPKDERAYRQAESLVQGWLMSCDEAAIIYIMTHSKLDDYERVGRVMRHCKIEVDPNMLAFVVQKVIANTTWLIRDYMYQRALNAMHDRQDREADLAD